MNFNRPRVALYYNVLSTTGFRNDGANLFLSFNFKQLLDGTDPVALYANPSLMTDTTGNFIPLSAIDTEHYGDFGKFDLHGLVDWGEDGLGIPLDWQIPHPNFYWIADSHLGYDYRLKRAKQFDTVFASHKPSIEKLVADGIGREKIHYLPWAAESFCYRPYPIVEKWDWCFIGYLNNEFRIDLIDRFCREWPVGDRGYLGWRNPAITGYNILEDAAKKYSQSRIILNESVRDDLNMRTPEVLACKRLLLTEDVSAVRDHFKDGEHLVLFKTIDEAVELAHRYLADQEGRERIAKAGYEEFLKNHTYMHRAKEILKTCLNWEPEEEPRKAILTAA
jgi:glycosyl transferase family 1